jgi:hypothetical protein
MGGARHGRGMLCVNRPLAVRDVTNIYHLRMSSLAPAVLYLKSKRIPSIFNDESTESFICLRRHIYVTRIAAMHIILRVLVVLYLRVTCICVVYDL